MQTEVEQLLEGNNIVEMQDWRAKYQRLKSVMLTIFPELRPDLQRAYLAEHPEQQNETIVDASSVRA